jgi:hypothetical protein
MKRHLKGTIGKKKFEVEESCATQKNGKEMKKKFRGLFQIRLMDNNPIGG